MTVAAIVAACWLAGSILAALLIGRTIHGPHGADCGCACPADSSNDTSRSFR